MQYLNNLITSSDYLQNFERIFIINDPVTQTMYRFLKYPYQH